MTDTAASSPLIVPETLEAFQEVFDPDEFAAFVRSYMDDARDRVRRILDAKNSGDYAELQVQSHDLKSTAGQLGSEILYEIAAKLEMSCRQGEVDALAPLTEEISGLTEEVCSAVEQHFLS